MRERHITPQTVAATIIERTRRLLGLTDALAQPARVPVRVERARGGRQDSRRRTNGQCNYRL